MIQKIGTIFLGVALFALVMFAGGQKNVQAGSITEISSTDCVEALGTVWDGLALLDASEMEELVNINKEINKALFYGTNGQLPVLTAQQQQALMNKFHLDFGGTRWPWTIEEYVHSHQSGGQTGYAGFVHSIQPEGRDLAYLAGLYDQLRLTFPNDYRVEMNDTWGWGERERLDFYAQMFKQIRFDATGNIYCPEFNSLVNQYILAVSKITEQDLEEVGFRCSTYQAAVEQLTAEQRDALAEIAAEMGKVEGSGISGYVYLEKVYPANPEPDHAGSVIKVKKGAQEMANTLSKSSGRYSLGGLTAGSYQISFDNPGGSWKEVDTPVSLGEDEYKQMPPVTLYLGDMNSDKAINILDLLWMAAKMGPVTPESRWADVIEDGQINILDLLRIAKNI